MKTPQQWAEHLPEPIRTEFLENVDTTYRDYKPVTPTILDALKWSFSWSESKQGWTYWVQVDNAAFKGHYKEAIQNRDPREIQLLRDVETEVNISGIISNHTYAEIVKLLKEIDGK